MMMKDLHPDYLRWHLLLQEFNFVMCDKELGVMGEPIETPFTHTLSNPEPAQK